MTEYVNMWKNYINFSDRTNVKGYWMAFLFNIIAAVVLSIIGRIISPLDSLGYIYSLAGFLPGIALTVRRLRDAGKDLYNILWVFLPVVGAIILIVLLCGQSVEDDGVPIV
jgi:uncharacterized membrane protein YhaH (DUF805 family)